MNDTHPAIALKYKKMLLAKSPEQRLLMGFSMFDAAKKIVESSIINNNPSLSAKQIKSEIFLRFYSQDFTEIQRNKIISKIGLYEST